MPKDRAFKEEQFASGRELPERFDPTAQGGRRVRRRGADFALPAVPNIAAAAPRHAYPAFGARFGLKNTIFHGRTVHVRNTPAAWNGSPFISASTASGESAS